MSQNLPTQKLLKKEICLDYFKALTLKQQNALVWAMTQLERNEDLEPVFAEGSLMKASSIIIETSADYVHATQRFLYRDGAYESMIDSVSKVAAVAIRALMLLQKKRKVAWKLRKKKPVPLKEN